MKIQTNQSSRFNHTINVCNEEVKFDKDGVANVFKELGEKIITQHDTFFRFGEVDMPEAVKVNKLREKIIEEYSEEVQDTITAFEDKIKILTSKNEGLSNENSQLKEVLEGWKTTVDELKAEVEPREKTITRLNKELKEVTENYEILNKADPDLVKKVEETKEDKDDKKVDELIKEVIKDTDNSDKDRKVLINRLYVKGKLKVVQAYARELEFPEKEWKGKNKKELCEYIVDKAEKNANS